MLLPDPVNGVIRDGEALLLLLVRPTPYPERSVHCRPEVVQYRVRQALDIQLHHLTNAGGESASPIASPRMLHYTGECCSTLPSLYAKVQL